MAAPSERTHYPAYLIGLSSSGRRLVLLQPLRSSTVDDLLPEPHQADERTERAGDHEAALQTVGEQVLSAGANRKFIVRLTCSIPGSRYGEVELNMFQLGLGFQQEIC